MEDLKKLTDHYEKGILYLSGKLETDNDMEKNHDFEKTFRDIEKRWARTCVGVLKKENLTFEFCY